MKKIIWLWSSAVVCGLLFALPYELERAAPVELAGTLVLLLALLREKYNRLAVWGAGILAGGAFSLPAVAKLELGLAGGAPLILVCVLFFLLLALSGDLLRERADGRAGLSAAVLAAALVWAEYMVCEYLSPWGRAQSMARVWGEYPALVGFVRYTGIYGITFLLFYLPAAVAVAVYCPRRRWWNIAGVALCLGLAAAGSWQAWRSAEGERTQPVQTMRELAVALCGTLERRVLPLPVEEAARQLRENYPDLPRLLVLPETAFASVAPVLTDDPEVRRLCEIAAREQIWICAGVNWRAQRKNILLAIAPDGKTAVYVKTHLLGEPFVAGDGQAAMLVGFPAGLLVCNDDNFMDVVSRCAVRQARLLVSPAEDWPQVERAHLQSIVLRALESGLPLVRATHRGYSAVISARGEMLAARSSLAEDGPVLVTARCALPEEASFHARHPDWFPRLAMALVIVIGIALWRHAAART